MSHSKQERNKLKCVFVSDEDDKSRHAIYWLMNFGSSFKYTNFNYFTYALFLYINNLVDPWF